MRSGVGEHRDVLYLRFGILCRIQILCFVLHFLISHDSRLTSVLGKNSSVPTYSGGEEVRLEKIATHLLHDTAVLHCCTCAENKRRVVEPQPISPRMRRLCRTYRDHTQNDGRRYCVYRLDSTASLRLVNSAVRIQGDVCCFRATAEKWRKLYTWVRYMSVVSSQGSVCGVSVGRAGAFRR